MTRRRAREPGIEPARASWRRRRFRRERRRGRGVARRGVGIVRHGRRVVYSTYDDRRRASRERACAMVDSSLAGANAVVTREGVAWDSFVDFPSAPTLASSRRDDPRRSEDGSLYPPHGDSHGGDLVLVPSVAQAAGALGFAVSVEQARATAKAPRPREFRRAQRQARERRARAHRGTCRLDPRARKRRTPETRAPQVNERTSRRPTTTNSRCFTCT